jgi:hypothetical protein
MRKTVITMATVALASGLFAGTALAGGDEHEKGGSSATVKYCNPINNQPGLVGNIANGLMGTWNNQPSAPVNCSG